MPTIAVHLVGPGGPVSLVTAVVDSGADCSCFPLGLAGILGIDLKDCVTQLGRTAGGESDQFWWQPGVRGFVAGHEIQFKGIFIDTPFALLGRQDFFRAFDIRFDERNAEFTVTRYSSDPDYEELFQDGVKVEVATPAEPAATPSDDTPSPAFPDPRS